MAIPNLRHQELVQFPPISYIGISIIKSGSPLVDVIFRKEAIEATSITTLTIVLTINITYLTISCCEIWKSFFNGNELKLAKYGTLTIQLDMSEIFLLIFH